MSYPAIVQDDCVSAFERIALRQPGRTAIVDGLSAISYGDLHELVGQRAHALRAAGTKSGYRIAVVAESSAEYLATALAVWKAGAVLVTVYPSSGSDDMSHAIESSEPALIVVSGGVDRAAIERAAPTTPIVGIDGFDVTSVRHDTAPNPADLREPLALICFSSGTTSRPKAIMLSAGAVFNCADTYGEVWHLSPDDRAIVCLPMAWMYGLASTSLAVLLRGGTVLVLRRGRPELIAQAIDEHSATFLAGVTVTFAKVVQLVETRPGAAPVFPSLRLCISGGEPRNEVVFDRWKSLTGVSVLDAYCASECLPLVTYDPETDPDPRPGSAGKLVPRARLRLVDAAGRDVPTGEAGEALSSGPGVMLGYWRDEEQTAAALTSDGWYRTKDLVRIDDEGYVYVLSRLSDLIIRGGTNISPAEVEDVLRRHPSVAGVAVVGVHDDIYGQSVVAAVVVNEGMDLDGGVLRAFAVEKLAAYKVPGSFVPIAALPVNSTTGKIDRRRVLTILAEQSDLIPTTGA